MLTPIRFRNHNTWIGTHWIGVRRLLGWSGSHQVALTASPHQPLPDNQHVWAIPWRFLSGLLGGFDQTWRFGHLSRFSWSTLVRDFSKVLPSFWNCTHLHLSKLCRELDIHLIDLLSFSVNINSCSDEYWKVKPVEVVKESLERTICSAWSTTVRTQLKAWRTESLKELRLLNSLLLCRNAQHADV